MKHRLLSFVLLFGVSAAAQAQPSRRIDFPGLTAKTIEKIYQHIPSLKDDRWTQVDLDLLIQYLVRDEQYDSAQILKESETLYRLAVGRVRRISSLDFKGNSTISEVDLRRETGLAEHIPFDPGLLVEAGEKIRAYYESKGFPKTQVDLQYVDSRETEVGVSIVVREGPRTLIDNFKIQTPNPELERVVRSLLKSYRREPLTPQTLADIRGKAREKLSSAGFWRTDLPDPKIERNIDESKAILVFKMDKSDQYFLQITGARQESPSTLKDFIGVDTYYSANPNIAGEIATKARAFYLSRGYARVDVQADETEGTKPHTRRIEVEIKEGPIVKIEKFEFSGSYSQPADFYVDFLREHSTPQIKSRHYVKDDLDAGLKNLVTDRWNQGFLRAKLVSTRTIYNKDRDKVTVLINLDEGPLTQVQKLTFTGNKSLSETELLSVVNLEEGKPLRLNALDEAVLQLKQHYRDHGFLEMVLLNEKEGLVTYNEDNTLAHLNFQIKEGPQVRVASILVEGNSITHDDVIMKELEFKRGDILTPQLIDESTSRLQRLGHFASVEIRTLEERTQIAERTVVIKVTDRDPGLFNAGAGFTNERGLTVRGFIGAAYRNLWGTGRGVSLRADTNYNVSDIKYPEYKLTASYLEPYLFNTRTRGRINLTRSVAISDFDKRQASEVNQTTWSLEQDITSHLLVVWDVVSIATVSDFFIQGDENRSTLNIGSTGLTVDLDYRDHPFNPTRGSFTRLNTEYGAPWLGSTETINYTRSFGSFTHYLPLFRIPNLVWANSLRGGYLKNLKDDGAVPYDKKGFLLGGQTSIRGFTPDEAFPSTRFDFGVDRFDLTTSASMTLLKSEIRFPLWWQNTGGAVFYDGGQVRVEGQTFDMGWRDSVGLAVRYQTPVGAVSLEYGWKLKPRGDRNENPSVFHFSIGTF